MVTSQPVLSFERVPSFESSLSMRRSQAGHGLPVQSDLSIRWSNPLGGIGQEIGPGREWVSGHPMARPMTKGRAQWPAHDSSLPPSTRHWETLVAF